MAFDIRNLPFAGTVTRWHSFLLNAMVVIKQEDKGPVAKLIEQERTKAFDAPLDRAQSECPDGEWLRAHEVREAVMSLTHVQIDEI